MKRPSHATVVAYLALFVALGGTTFAATHLGKNSVGSKQLKKNAVTTAKIKLEAVTGDKIKKGTITGMQINLSALGTVPSAQTAQTAQSAQTAQTARTLPPPEPWHEIGAPGEPQFVNGCKQYEAKTPVRFYKDHDGVVHLEGAYFCPPGGPNAFQLPAGYRPFGFQRFPQPFGETLSVLPTVEDPPQSGAVRCDETTCYLNGVTFRAES